MCFILKRLEDEDLFSLMCSCHDIAEILLTFVLNGNQSLYYYRKNLEHKNYILVIHAWSLSCIDWLKNLQKRKLDTILLFKVTNLSLIFV